MRYMKFAVVALLLLSFPLSTSLAAPGNERYGAAFFEYAGHDYAIGIGQNDRYQEALILYQYIDNTAEVERATTRKAIELERVTSTMLPEYEIPDHSRKRVITDLDAIKRRIAESRDARQRQLVREYPELSIIDIGKILEFEYPSNPANEHIKFDGTIDIKAHYDRIAALPPRKYYQWKPALYGPTLGGKKDYQLPELVTSFRFQVTESLKRVYAKPLDKKRLIKEFKALSGVQDI